MGEARLARYRQGTPSHQAGCRDAVVGRAKRTAAHEPVSVVLAGDAVDAGHLDGLRSRQAGQDRGQAASEHGLARPRGSAEQQVMGACGGDGQRLNGDLVSEDVPEIGAARGGLGGGRGLTGAFDDAVTAQQAHYLDQGTSAGHRDAVDETRLAHALTGHHQPAQAKAMRPLGDGERAGTPPQVPAQRQLREQCPAVELPGRQLPAGGQDPAGQREVKPRSRLAQMRWRQVGGDAPLGKLKPTVQQGGAYALTRLAHRGVAQAHDREAGQPRPNVHLHRDRAGVDSVDGKGPGPGEHGVNARGRGVSVQRLAVTDLQRQRTTFAPAQRRRCPVTFAARMWPVGAHPGP